MCVYIYVYICVCAEAVPERPGAVPCELLCPEVVRQWFCDGGCPLHVSCIVVAVLAHPVNLGCC